MNMTDRFGALMLMLFLFVFLAQCRPHEELVVVGTAMDRPVPSPDHCIVAHDDNRELYCCGHMRCLVCYDTRDKCKAKCQGPLTICN
ncbi:hypothetical protein BDA96_10G012600 [Sorghum bicolor]|uniref:Uncharacterized protein n=2 Tax=Sorghum bicolor TaxID=4558 RepID=A0A921PZ29_SORBI|nr:hypothetical protein SORBI_3010G010600 [Sorghum bicolor]KAG0512431.1 hypothetical protein BDA96_10G012600 [Sorghum bicolor]